MSLPTITIYGAAHPLAEPRVIATSAATVPTETYAAHLAIAGWQHVADGPNDARLYAHPDTLIMIEITP